MKTSTVPKPQVMVSDDSVAPSSRTLGGFRYIRKNIAKKEVTYACIHSRDCECKSALVYQLDPKSGKIREEVPPVMKGEHERSCTVKTKLQNSYEGKKIFEEEKKSDD